MGQEEREREREMEKREAKRGWEETRIRTLWVNVGNGARYRSNTLITKREIRDAHHQKPKERSKTRNHQPALSPQPYPFMQRPPPTPSFLPLLSTQSRLRRSHAQYSQMAYLMRRASGSSLSVW